MSGAENEKGKIYGFSTSLLPSPNTLMYSLPPPPPPREEGKKIGADTKPQQFILGFVIFKRRSTKDFFSLKQRFQFLMHILPESC